MTIRPGGMEMPSLSDLSGSLPEPVQGEGPVLEWLTIASRCRSRSGEAAAVERPGSAVHLVFFLLLWQLGASCGDERVIPLFTASQ
jgi:hypothetical protein